jgi:hypothetical protein
MTPQRSASWKTIDEFKKNFDSILDNSRCLFCEASPAGIRERGVVKK